jgi:hypothetical protein
MKGSPVRVRASALSKFIALCGSPCESGNVPLTVPLIDKRDYAELLAEALGRIPVHAPEWTDVNPSDAGVTLLELFAFLGEELLAYLEDDRARRRRRRRWAVLLAGVSGAALAFLWVRRNNTAAP